MLKYLVEVYDKNANLKPFVYKSGDNGDFGWTKIVIENRQMLSRFFESSQSFSPFQINKCNNRTFCRQLSRVEEGANKFVDVTMLRIVDVVI